VNRAILIVICDFLVSTMLSMMTGMVPVHTGGTGVGLDEHTTRTLLADLAASQKELERVRAMLREAAKRAGGANASQEAKLRELTEKLVENLRQQQKLEQQLRRTPETTGKLSPAQLQAELEKELRRRMAAELALRDRQEDLAGIRAEARDLRQANLAAGREIRQLAQENMKVQQEKVRIQQEKIRIQQQTIEARQETARVQQQAAATAVRLTAAERELAHSREAEAKAAADLAGVRETLRQMNARLGEANRDTRELQQSLAFVTGKYNVAERTVADYQGQIAKLRREHSRLELTIGQKDRQIIELKQLVVRNVTELSQAKREVTASREKAVAAVEREKAMKNQLAEAVRRSENNVLRDYGNAVVQVSVAIDEERLMLDQHGGGTYFLPLVDFGGKHLLVGSLRQLAGGGGVPIIFNRITRLAYHLSSTVKGAPAKEYTGALLSLPEDRRLAALECPKLPGGRTPLAVVTAAELRRRGLHNLYLFKPTSAGKESAELAGRCSLDPAETRAVLRIRNPERGASELRAEPGDFVLTREGDFVGVVVEEAQKDFGRSRLALVYLFPDRKTAWRNAERIALTKPEGAKYFDTFGERIRHLLDDRSRR